MTTTESRSWRRCKGSLASLTSSIIKGVEENGRTYAVYGQEECGMPMDEVEMNRIDMAHAKHFMLLENKQSLTPIDTDVQKVLDLGTETGAWSIDFADAYPSAEVVEIDIAPIQSTCAPPNCQFQVDDITQPWTWKKDTFDFVFARDILSLVRNWLNLISQCYDHIKPGGWIEFQLIHGVLGCDDDTLPLESKFREHDKHIRAAAVAFGTPLEDPVSFKKWFDKAVVEKKYKIPSNPWPKDPRLKLVGALEQENFVAGLEGMSIRSLDKLGWNLDDSKRSLGEEKTSYCRFYVVYGRKPNQENKNIDHHVLEE
ncbi:putative glucose sequence protein [Botrytis fragariae]|uniref:Putative glucose sequence protein n=1 Tax=Botrytis fragariae TaxID=1964551 RepID=A0A8H6AX00_9HELO|nr:putative glucose sequence protein [Botrytis fragariae]KAF5875348.1 putative glucose sequence protein [Botrytis fragariae]